MDLPGQIISLPDGGVETFEIDPYRKECLIKGMDDLDYLLSNIREIQRFDREHQKYVFFNTKVL